MTSAAEWHHDVFISYNRRDERIVDFVEQSLIQSGLRCFRDVSGLGIYDKLDASLKRSIARSRWLMAVISPAYLQSYWCMFEALEALQGQDLSLRFLPIALKYSVDDPTLDETFILDALSELREKSRALEEQIITSRTFALGDRLDKLSFIQNNLPKLFLQIRDRIHPVFHAWDPIAVRGTMQSLIVYLDPPTRPDLDIVRYDPPPIVAVPINLPRPQGDFRHFMEQEMYEHPTALMKHIPANDQSIHPRSGIA